MYNHTTNGQAVKTQHPDAKIMSATLAAPGYDRVQRYMLRHMKHDCAQFLCYLMGVSLKHGVNSPGADGWFFHSQDQIEEALYISRYHQHRLINYLKTAFPTPLIETTHRDGRRYLRINAAAVEALRDTPALGKRRATSPTRNTQAPTPRQPDTPTTVEHDWVAIITPPISQSQQRGPSCRNATDSATEQVAEMQLGPPKTAHKQVAEMQLTPPVPSCRNATYPPADQVAEMQLPTIGDQNTDQERDKEKIREQSASRGDAGASLSRSHSVPDDRLVPLIVEGMPPISLRQESEAPEAGRNSEEENSGEVVRPLCTTKSKEAPASHVVESSSTAPEPAGGNPMTARDYAVKLRDRLMEKRLLMRVANIPKWTEVFARLLTTFTDGEVREVFDWYMEHMGAKYVSQAYSAQTFHDKFPNLKKQMEQATWNARATQPVGSQGVAAPVVLCKVGREVLEEMTTFHGWPWGLEDELHALIAQSMPVAEEFYRRLARIIPSWEALNPTSGGCAARAFDGYCSCPRSMLVRWLEQLLAKAKHWTAHFQTHPLKLGCKQMLDVVRSVFHVTGYPGYTLKNMLAEMGIERCV